MNTQRTSGHSRDDLWFHTQGEEDQTLAKCSGIFRRDAEPTVSLFTHIRFSGWKFHTSPTMVTPSHHGMCFFRQKLRSQTGDIDMGGQRCYCHGQFSHINLGTRYLRSCHTARYKKKAKPGASFTLTTSENQSFHNFFPEDSWSGGLFGGTVWKWSISISTSSIGPCFFSLLAKFIFSEIRSSWSHQLKVGCVCFGAPKLP